MKIKNIFKIIFVLIASNGFVKGVKMILIISIIIIEFLNQDIF